jgi:hypothetical protein
MNEPTITDVIYKSGTLPNKPGWDVLLVIYKSHGTFINSFVIALDEDGSILRRVDPFLDQWERITNEDDLRQFRACFDARDEARSDPEGKG